MSTTGTAAPAHDGHAEQGPAPTGDGLHRQRPHGRDDGGERQRTQQPAGAEDELILHPVHPLITRAGHRI
ncbi:hypothetical protein [Dactylosporangium sp. NPDC049140]|uniref:hypothetical protein n=1 Tax=Dactylosporangium sp. NPDC049140 TaxID=3155647 RepID=UPI0033EEECCB